jgi:hypothetical protein
VAGCTALGADDLFPRDPIEETEYQGLDGEQQLQAGGAPLPAANDDFNFMLNEAGLSPQGRSRRRSEEGQVARESMRQRLQ